MIKSQENVEHSLAFAQPLILPEEHSSKFLYTGRKYISYNSGQIKDDKDNRIWWVYETDVEIGRVIQWLNGRYMHCYITYVFMYVTCFKATYYMPLY
jgi:hypothetical protein